MIEPLLKIVLLLGGITINAILVSAMKYFNSYDVDKGFLQHETWEKIDNMKLAVFITTIVVNIFFGYFMCRVK